MVGESPQHQACSGLKLLTNGLMRAGSSFFRSNKGSAVMVPFVWYDSFRGSKQNPEYDINAEKVRRYYPCSICVPRNTCISTRKLTLDF